MSKYIIIEVEKLYNLINSIKNTEDDFEKGKRAALRSLELTFGVIDTDQSIEERAKKYADLIDNDNSLENFLSYKEGATEQRLIEQMKAKEKNADYNYNEKSQTKNIKNTLPPSPPPPPAPREVIEGKIPKRKK